METSNAIPARMRNQVEVQTPGGTSIGDIVISQDQTLAELKRIADDFERELEMELNNSKENSSSKKETGNKKTNGSQKEKKRKREEDCDEDDTEEANELSVKYGDQVFMETRTGKAHYHQVIKEMEHIKGMPAAILLANMTKWVLACEIRRQKSKNINGILTRQMRE